MNRPVHFEIHAENPERAAKFYHDVFEWEIAKWGEDPYWLIMTAPRDSKEPGINGGLMPRRGPRPEEGVPINAYVCTIEVDDINEYDRRIIKAGGKNIVEKTAVENVGTFAYYKDTEGNIFGIIQSEITSK